MVPVALLGTREVLPKNGAFAPTPMEVRFGEPLDPSVTTAQQVRDHILALRDADEVRRTRVWAKLAKPFRIQ